MPNWQNTVVFLWIWKEKCAHRQNNIQSLETNLKMLCFSWFTVSQGSSSLRATFFQHLLNLSKEKEKTFWRQTFAFVRHNSHYISLKSTQKISKKSKIFHQEIRKKLLRNPKNYTKRLKNYWEIPRQIIQKSKFHRETKQITQKSTFFPRKKDFFWEHNFFPKILLVFQKYEFFQKIQNSIFSL